MSDIIFRTSSLICFSIFLTGKGTVDESLSSRKSIGPVSSVVWVFCNSERTFFSPKNLFKMRCLIILNILIWQQSLDYLPLCNLLHPNSPTLYLLFQGGILWRWATNKSYINYNAVSSCWLSFHERSTISFIGFELSFWWSFFYTLALPIWWWSSSS